MSAPARRPLRAVPDEEDAPHRRLADAATVIGAPDVVLAFSRHGRRTVHHGGTATAPPVPRDLLRYETGSASKIYAGLLMAHLTCTGRLSGGEPAARCLDPRRAVGPDPVTLTHLITHTAGLPPLPADFYLRALPAWRTNPYARYSAAHVVAAFARHRPRHRPGTRWRYSNFGVAVLGHALAAALQTPWDTLLAEEVLRPLGLNGTALTATGPDTDALGHRPDGTPVPALDAGGFRAAGAVRATPGDLLTLLEAHLDPPPGAPLADALREVRRPVLRRGVGHRHVHTLTWFRHPTDHGPMYFHSGATLGQQTFLGFRPGTGTALAAVCTRRHHGRDPFVPTAYALLADAL